MSAAPHETPLSLNVAGGMGSLVRVEHGAMACRWEILLVGERAGYARQAAEMAFAEVDRLELELSRFIEHSDIARINRLRAGEAARVGIEALECLELAAQVRRETGGAFDVTIGALLRGAAGGGAPANATCGMHLIDVDRAARTVTVRADGLKVDLGAIGKGYAIDRAVAVLHEWSIGTALIHSGQSTIYAVGSPSDEAGWPIGIRNPLDHGKTLGEIRVLDAALGGSGVLLHGRHIIDPRTATPAQEAIGAWAIAPTTALADAYSTAFMVLTADEVRAFCHQHPEVSAMQFVETPDGHALHRFGPGFATIRS